MVFDVFSLTTGPRVATKSWFLSSGSEGRAGTREGRDDSVKPRNKTEEVGHNWTEKKLKGTT